MAKPTRSNHNVTEWIEDYMAEGYSREDAVAKAKEELSLRKIVQSVSRKSRQRSTPHYYPE